MIRQRHADELRPTAVALAAPSTLASLLLLLAVVTAFALFALATPRPSGETAGAATVVAPVPTPATSQDFTFVLVASREQASRLAAFAGRLQGEVQVRVVATAADEAALVADVVELNGFRAQTGLPEVRRIDLR